MANSMADTRLVQRAMSILTLTMPHATDANTKVIAERARLLGATNVSIEPLAGRFVLSRLLLELFPGRKIVEITAPRARVAALAHVLEAMAPGSELRIEEAELWVPLTLIAQTETT